MGLFSFLFSGKKKKREKRKIKPKEFTFFKEEYADLIYKTPIDLNEAIYLAKNSVCGNCGCILDEIKNNRKCPECREPIIIRSDIISKQKVQLNKSNLKEFLEYDRKARNLIFMENLMKRYSFLYTNNMELFYSCKGMYKDPKYVVKEFANKCNIRLEKEGFRRYGIVIHYDVESHFNDWYEMLRILSNSIEANKLYFEIANYDEEYEIAYNLLDVIAYQSAQLVPLYKLFYNNVSHIDEQELFQIPSNLILNFLNNNNYTIEDFYHKFMENHHQFLIKTLSNNDALICLKRAIQKYKDNNIR